MTTQDLFRAGRLQDAVQSLGAELRDHPMDHKRRSFLFELLCFSGDFKRAEKHLNLLADASPDAQVGALVYRSAMAAERKRQVFFENRQWESPEPPPVSRPGTLNGERFETIEDADARIGPRLELYLAGEYLWLPLAHVRKIEMQPPKMLRDLLWSSAVVTAGPELKGQDFGEILLPILYPVSWQHPRETVRLGRETDWMASGDQEVPYGQKLLVLDGERIVPYLEIRTLEFDAPPVSDDTESTDSTVEA